MQINPLQDMMVGAKLVTDLILDIVSHPFLQLFVHKWR